MTPRDCYGGQVASTTELIDLAHHGRWHGSDQERGRRDLEPVDWQHAWDRYRRGDTETDWLIEPVFPLGAHALIYAAKKSEKSLFVLGCAAAVATGRSVLGRPASDPGSVLVLDFENEIDKDVLPRLADYGYSDDPLNNLFWYSFPRIAPLDTEAGARQLDELIERHKPQFVVLDSFARIVSGPENDADTVRSYYRHAGLVLKRHGVTSVRLDNTGHDESHARGSSAKGDDVDLIWRLRRREYGIRLERDAQRGTLVPAAVNLHRHDNPLRYALVPDSYPAGTEAAIALLDRFNIPCNTTNRGARAALKNAGESVSNEVLSAAVRARREHGAHSGPPNGTDFKSNTEHDQ